MLPIWLSCRAIFTEGPGERDGMGGEGRGSFTRSLRALRVHLFVTLAVECCQCHMASQGSFNWFRAEADTVISINHSVRRRQGASSTPGDSLLGILNGAVRNTEVRKQGS